jgi:hypothetical protein
VGLVPLARRLSANSAWAHNLLGSVYRLAAHAQARVSSTPIEPPTQRVTPDSLLQALNQLTNRLGDTMKDTNEVGPSEM